MNHVDFIRQIAVNTVDASEDELRVLLVLAERLNAGRVAYGRLNVGTDPRDWKLERRLELYDAMLYTVIAEMADERRSRDELPTLPDGASLEDMRLVGAARGKASR